MTEAGSKPKILIVDDIAENLIAMEKLLKRLEVDIVKAASGNEALSSILYNDFALIILDVQMPEMDGFEVAQILKADDKTEMIPIIFVTAIDREDAKEISGYSKGAVDFIFKPLNEFILLSKVNVFLEMYKIKTRLETCVSERTLELRQANEELKAQIARNEEANKELARARSYLVNVINSISSALIGVDSKARIVNMNTEAEIIAGMTSLTAKGKNLEQVFPFYPGLTEQAFRSMKAGKPEEKNRVIVTIDESVFVKNFCVYPLIDNGTRGAVLRVDDVTERARIDEMMIQSEKMLSIGGLAAGMAHEINNPLAGIIQNTQVLRNRMTQNFPANVDAAKACGITLEALNTYMEKRGMLKMVDSIVASGQRAAQIVENMLNFSRKSEGPEKGENLCMLMDQTLELAKNDYDLKKKFDFRQIEIRKHYQTDMPLVICHGNKIQQVLLNILTNGAHAMAKKPLGKDKKHRFDIFIRSENQNACIEIRDTGTGMDKSVCKRIFEPFFTTKKAGTGLGLSISYFIITEDHGGTLEVHSTPGKGSAFIICLPFSRALEATLTHPA